MTGNDLEEEGKRNLVTYTGMGGSIVIDLNAVCGLIGRFQVGTVNKRWAVIDRTGPYAQAVFLDPNEHLDELYDS